MKSRQKHPLDQRGKSLTVRNGSLRKLARDGKSWTPTESVKRDRLMKQFSKRGRKGYGVVQSAEYKASAIWCACGNGMKAPGRELCRRCDPSGPELTALDLPGYGQKS